MATTKQIQEFFHKLMELKEDGYDIEIEENGYKNYTSYIISKESGSARYSDCIVFYNGDSDAEYPENVCEPQDIPVEELLESIELIVKKIDKVFE